MDFAVFVVKCLLLYVSFQFHVSKLCRVLASTYVVRCSELLVQYK